MNKTRCVLCAAERKPATSGPLHKCGICDEMHCRNHMSVTVSGTCTDCATDRLKKVWL